MYFHIKRIHKDRGCNGPLKAATWKKHQDKLVTRICSSGVMWLNAQRFFFISERYITFFSEKNYVYFRWGIKSLRKIN